MIGAAIVALQIAGAVASRTAPAVLAVRAARSEAMVPLVPSSSGLAVPLDRLAPVIPIGVRPGAAGRFRVSFPGVEVEVGDRIPFVKIGPDIIPLVTAPFLSSGRLYLPFQLVTEVIPRYAPTRLRYDRARAELRLLDSASRPVLLASGPPPSSSTTGREVSRESRPERHGSPRLARRHRVIVDAGHGGVDPGMSGPLGSRDKILEKDITLTVARKLRTALAARGIDVVMTRTRDTLISLSDRGRIANEKRGDLFISIHVNAASPHWQRPADGRGFETYFLAEAKTEDARRVERMENEAIRFETNAAASKNDPLSFIINDMAQNEHLRESSELADLIQGEMADVHPGPNRGVKQAGFRVLVTAFMPAVLVEIGFGTNLAEARYLENPSQQGVLADAIASATVAYLDRYERRIGAAIP